MATKTTSKTLSLIERRRTAEKRLRVAWARYENGRMVSNTRSIVHLVGDDGMTACGRSISPPPSDPARVAVFGREVEGRDGKLVCSRCLGYA